MQITFLIDNIAACGGTERVSLRIANELVCRGHEVAFVSRTRNGDPFFACDERVALHHLAHSNKQSKLDIALSVFELMVTLRKLRCDVLVVVDLCHCHVAVPAAQLAGCKIVGWEHFNFERHFQNGRPLRSYRACSKLDAMVTLTEEDAEAHKTYGLVPDGVIRSIPNPLSFDMPSELRNDPPKRFISLARLASQKNPLGLACAWERIASDLPDWELVYVGEGPQRGDLERLIAQRGIPRVILAGRSDDVGLWLRNSYAMVCMSEYEGYPLSIIESFSYGLPVAYTACHWGPQQLIQDGLNGYLVPMGNDEAMGEAMLKLARLSSSQYMTMRCAARKVAASFDVSVITDAWEQLLSEVI